MRKPFCWYCVHGNRGKTNQIKATLFMQCASDEANEGQPSDMVAINDACDFYKEKAYEQEYPFLESAKDSTI